MSGTTSAPNAGLWLCRRCGHRQGPHRAPWTWPAANAAPGVLAIVTAENAGKLGKGKLQHGASCWAGRRSSTTTRPSRWWWPRPSSRRARPRSWSASTTCAQPGAFDLAAAKDSARAGAEQRRAAGHRGRRLRRRLRRGAGEARRDLHHARPVPRDDGAACVDRRLGRRQADAVDLEPDDRLERRRPGQDARHSARRRCALMSPFIGGGFGGKLFLRADALLAALGARAARRPVKVALQRAADRQQHHASAGHHPAHPPRRHRGRQDHRHRPRELVRRPARRQAGGAVQPDAPALCRRQPHDGHAPGRARPAGRQCHARARRGAGPDGAGDRHGRDGGEAGHGSGRRSASLNDTQVRSRQEARSERAILAAPAGRVPADRAPSVSAGTQRNARPGQVRDGRWLVGMGVAAAFRNNLLHEVRRARAAGRTRHRDRRDRHDRHRHRQLHHHRADRRRDDGRAARQGGGATGRFQPSRCRPVPAASGAATARPPVSMRPA